VTGAHIGPSDAPTVTSDEGLDVTVRAVGDGRAASRFGRGRGLADVVGACTITGGSVSALACGFAASTSAADCTAFTLITQLTKTQDGRMSVSELNQCDLSRSKIIYRTDHTELFLS
jgi:hypothetical protein